ncbi:MAG: P-loop NTPase [Candidatus Latescibacteria bacterium]|nr:P-loop NTPase [Candidatus Latescibacterota bacterium]
MAAPRSLAITSGKGGVGKSCVTLNLAVSLARCRQRVLLVDADLGLGNQAILQGLSPGRTLEEVLSGRCPIEAAVLEGPEGIALLPAASEPRPWQPVAHLAPLRSFEAQFDLVLVDTGAGLAPKVLDFAAAADQVLFLTTPEATAIADAYALFKVLLQRRPALAAGLLVNMAESAQEAAQLQENFAELAIRFLGAEIDNWGYIPLDRYVREAAKRQIPFILATPPPPAARALARLAENLVEGRPTTEPQGLFAPLWRQFLSSGSPEQAPT